jgi:hypothetical protein
MATRSIATASEDITNKDTTPEKARATRTVTIGHHQQY